jgi:hypothetical protein
LKVKIDKPTGKDERLQEMKAGDEKLVGILCKNDKT